MTDERRGERLAPWVGALQLSDQIFLTGTVLVLRGIRERRDDLPFVFDERRLNGAATPEIAARYARQICAAYEVAPPYGGPDGVDEHWRIASMTRQLALTIENRYARPGRD
ncbi:MAG: hypothetical protein Q7T71_04720 [Herbiconiux sp.]|nr:hypothetical protein [Herbiconiux sp.]